MTWLLLLLWCNGKTYSEIVGILRKLLEYTFNCYWKYIVLVFWFYYRAALLHNNKRSIGHVLCPLVYHSAVMESGKKCKNYSKTKYIQILVKIEENISNSGIINIWFLNFYLGEFAFYTDSWRQNTYGLK